MLHRHEKTCDRTGQRFDGGVRHEGIVFPATPGLHPLELRDFDVSVSFLPVATSQPVSRG